MSTHLSSSAYVYGAGERASETSHMTVSLLMSLVASVS